MTQVSPTQLALGPLIEACKRRQLLTNGLNPASICWVASTFRIGEEIWSGMAIATPDALMLLKRERLDSPLPGKESDANLTTISERPLDVFYSDLPSILTGDEAWPAPKHPQCPVTVLLRDKVKIVRPVPFTTAIDFVSNYPLIRLECEPKEVVPAADGLKRTGWIREAPAATPVARPMSGNGNLPKVAIGASAAILLILGIVVVYADIINTQVAMLLTLPVMAFGVWGAYRLMAGQSPQMPRQHADC